ncbi:kinase-like domain-containing protein [Gigaspora rosea]|uniref:Kinase-like domain-containing protein n=1 Tax=Gigaspora rosea TaxID=44941 RepID=A0A397VU07_9GLOM|nr:kinase-like domain-containing protein [Gigaspora rosea]
MSFYKLKGRIKCFMILEYARDGNLRDYLRQNFKNLDWKKKFSIGKQIANGLKALHDQNIAHKDLNPNNVLVHGDRMMITDFGISKSSLLAWDSFSKKGMAAYIDPILGRSTTSQKTISSQY